MCAEIAGIAEPVHALSLSSVYLLSICTVYCNLCRDDLGAQAWFRNGYTNPTLVQKIYLTDARLKLKFTTIIT